MIASRRLNWNFALDRTVEWTEKLHKPLVVLEALRCAYPWASDRIHRFAMDGMAENACRLEGTDVIYYPYLELTPDAAKGLLAALASRACVVVTDEFHCSSCRAWSPPRLGKCRSSWKWWTPMDCFRCGKQRKPFQPLMLFAASYKRSSRRHLEEFPKANATAERQPAQAARASREDPEALAEGFSANLISSEKLSGRNSVGSRDSPSGDARGSIAGPSIAERLSAIQAVELTLEARNEPAQQATSALAPYLHFGHISAHQIFCEVTARERWSPAHLALRATGSRSGWWGASQATEAFLDQLVTWRELGFNFCHMRRRL